MVVFCSMCLDVKNKCSTDNVSHGASFVLLMLSSLKWQTDTLH